ncbi:MAG: PAS domain S-box protein, partial [Anaerolineae bacterium]|nr:PAS domain S-box protein [Anaerolineae bacterium]
RVIALNFINQGLAEGQRVVLLSAGYSDAIIPATPTSSVENRSDSYFEDNNVIVFSQKMDKNNEDGFDIDRFTDWLTAAAELTLQSPDNVLCTGIRVLTQTDNILTDINNPGQLESYEEFIDQYFTTNQCIVLCQYQRHAFPPKLLIEALTTHPTLIIGREVVNNFYYIPSPQKAPENSLQTRLDQWITNLLVAHKTEEELFLTHTWVEGASDMVLWIDENGSIVYANSTACERLGYERSELLTSNIEAIEPAYPLPVWQQTWADLKEKRYNTYETEMLTRNKQAIPVEVKRNLIAYGGREYSCGIAHDISEHKRREKLQQAIYQLSEASNFARTQQDLFKNVHKIIATLIPAQNLFIALYDSDSNIVSFPYYVDEYDSPPAPRKDGKGLTEFLIKTGRPLYYSPDSEFNLREHGILYLGTYAPCWMGVPLKTTDGRIIGSLVVQSYNYDVSYGDDELTILTFVSSQIAMAIERQRAEEELRDSEENFRMLVEGIKDYAAFMLDLNGFVLSWNSGAERMKGYQASEIIGKHFSVFYCEDDIEHNLPRFELSLAARKGSLEHEGWRVRKDGSKFYARIVINALYNPRGEVYGFIKVVRDISASHTSQSRNTDYRHSALNDF